MRNVSLSINLEKDDPDYKELKSNAEALYENLRDRVKTLTLSEEERVFYIDRVRAYLKDFPMLNLSSDLDDLHNYCMELIIQQRMVTEKNFGQAYNESIKRCNAIKESFAVRRLDRKRMPEKQEDFVKIMQDLFSLNQSDLEKIDKELLKEESEFKEKKKARDLALGLETADQFNITDAETTEIITKTVTEEIIAETPQISGPTGDPLFAPPKRRGRPPGSKNLPKMETL